MSKKTPFRDRVRRVFSRSTSNSDFYKPGEKIPSKYPPGLSKPHQDMLAAWSFFKNDSRRRASAQSMESPMGSRVHSRMHSRSPSEASNVLKEERTIEEREEHEWSKTNRSSETASEVTLRERDQNLHIQPKLANVAAPSTGRCGDNDLLRSGALNAVAP